MHWKKAACRYYTIRGSESESFHLSPPPPGGKSIRLPMYSSCWVSIYLFPFFQISLIFQRCPSYIESQNFTRVSEFFLLGLSDDPELQPLLFGLFLSMYLVTILGNLLIILVVSSDCHLHTPMYFFLSNLSLADIGFTTTTIPKMMVDIQTHSRVIPYGGCVTQMSIVTLFGCLDSLLLTVMAYDRFVAICHPLHYSVIMNTRLCGLLVLVSFFISLLYCQLHSLMVSQLTFPMRVEIPHFFCDPSQLFNLACSDTSSNNVLIYFMGAILGGGPLIGILSSYIRIVSTTLRVSSTGVKYKAFSTCGSHLSVVCLFYGTALGVYLSSAVSHSPRKGAVASVMYTVVTPMLNPFIYSLRNGDMKRAMQKFLRRTA
ncbi:olfactory receptor 7E178-like [Equus przewalskii]|uniref:Olfactory receptor n=1 Tax=Equus przewalskii TaxID=9798 RepID=A0ABM4PZU7_EQUPR